MKNNVFRFEYKSGKSIELEIKENIVFVREYFEHKLIKDFFVSFTGIVNCCYIKNRRK